MPIAKKSESEMVKVNVSNQLAPDALETLTELNKKIPETEVAPSEPESSETVETGKKYSDTVIARLSTGKRAEFKSFFSKYGITMNSGIEMCIEYVMEQVESGNARISKAGVK